MEYIFHDTGKGISPDTDHYLDRLEGYLGTRIVRTNFGTTFDHLLRTKGWHATIESSSLVHGINEAPACSRTSSAKIFASDDVGIRADEERVGYISHKPNIRAVFPFRDDGIDYEGVQGILEEAGLRDATIH